jgi:cyclopropane fatty-acyl-phospholipid synthase-like methyltransferase
MSARVDLYDSAYANYGSEIYRQVRMETYGEDFGQTSWVSTEESREIPQLLDLKPNSSPLEVGSGSGGYALYLAERVAAAFWVWTSMHPEFTMRTNSIARVSRRSRRKCNALLFPR